MQPKKGVADEVDGNGVRVVLFCVTSPLGRFVLWNMAPRYPYTGHGVNIEVQQTTSRQYHGPSLPPNVSDTAD